MGEDVTETRVVPHNLTAEESLLGAMLLSPSAIRDVVGEVHAADFHSPAHQKLFEIIVRLHQTGEPTDPVSVGDVLRRDGLPADGLIALQVQTPSVASAGRYARIVAEHAARKRLIELCENFQVRAYDGAEEADEIVKAMQADLRDVDAGSGVPPQDVYSFDEFDALPTDTSPWVIPGLLRSSWRSILVAEEGVGKSWISRQVAVCASAGLDPFSLRPIDPQPVLLVDLENPADVVQSHLRKVRWSASQRSQLRAPAHIWHRIDGIDLRSRKDRSEFTGLLNRTRPRLVCLGPIYKAYRVKARETDEQVAGEIQSVLDDLRTRFGFAMLLEHHAPHGESSTSRAVRPYGSSLWLRWPEFGIALRKVKEMPSSLEVGRWRGDRVKPNGWPDRLDRGSDMPWVGYWQNGITEQW